MSQSQPIRRRGKSPAERDAHLRRVAVERFATGEFDDMPAERDAAISFLRTLRSAQTMSTYASNLIQLFRWCRQADVRPNELKRSLAKAYEAELHELSECARDARCVAARSFYNHVLDDDEPPIKSNPFFRVGPRSPKPIEQTPALQLTDVDELIDYLRQRARAGRGALIHKRDLALIYLMSRVGPRRITMSRLRWKDVRRERGRTLLHMHLKGNRYEKIDLPDDVVAVLAGWFRAFGTALGRELDPEDAVFPPIGSRTNSMVGYDRLEPMDAPSISHIVTVRLKAIGISGKGWSAHALRATAATIADENGASLEEIQAMLCHLNRAQTEGYIRRSRPKASAARRWVPSVVRNGELGDGNASGPAAFLGPGEELTAA